MNLDNSGGSGPNAQPHSEPRYEFKGVWIPAALWTRKDLTWLQKCILAEIDNLSKGCFASNAYLAKHMGIAERTLTNNLAELRKKNLLIDWGFNGRFRQVSVADCISSNPKHTRNRVGSIPATGYSDPPESGTIDTSRVTSVVTNKAKESRKRSVSVSEEEKDRLMREVVQVPKNAPDDQELADILSRFPSIQKLRGSSMFFALKGTKFHTWKKNRWVPILNLIKYLEVTDRKLSKLVLNGS